MGRKLAAAGEGGAGHKAVGSMACLIFVVLLALAFWAGALWIAQFLMRVGTLRY